MNSWQMRVAVTSAVAVGLVGSLSGAALAAPVNLPAKPASEVEPDDAFGTASAIVPGTRVRAALFPAGDIDYYRFTATAGDRVYAATMTSGSSGNSTNSQLTLLGSDGTTQIEFDDDNGSFAAQSSSIAGATIPTTGTYYLRVNDFTPATASERPYDLYLDVRSGAPAAENEINDTTGQANLLPGGWASGAISSGGDVDQYAITLAAGDTLYAALDLDPERDGVTFNGRLSVGLVGDDGLQYEAVDDAGAAEPAPAGATIPSEAFFFTARTAGTYYVRVDSANAATGDPTFTYMLDADVIQHESPDCHTYSVSPNAALGPGNTSTTVDIPVTDTFLIDRLAINIDLNHAQMADLDVSIQRPDLSEVGLFTDIGASATGGQTQMNALWDKWSGTPPAFTTLTSVALQPELNYRLEWFEGEQAQGTWHLVLRDDTNNAAGGTINSVGLILCPQVPEPTDTSSIFSADFETGDDGFTHSGTADEWERGTPATVATTTANPVAGISTCASGSTCWKTDLDNTYPVNANMDLVSPNISLVGRTGTITASWWQWYQLESASFDHYYVYVERSDGTGTRPLFTWLNATMTNSAATRRSTSPPTPAGASGWLTSPTSPARRSGCASTSTRTTPSSSPAPRSTTCASTSRARRCPW